MYTLGALVSLQLLDAAAYDDEAYDMEVVDGNVPTDLDGVLYRNVRPKLRLYWKMEQSFLREDIEKIHKYRCNFEEGKPCRISFLFFSF